MDRTRLSVALAVLPIAGPIDVTALPTATDGLRIDDTHIEADGMAPLDACFEMLDEFSAPPSRPTTRTLS